MTPKEKAIELVEKYICTFGEGYITLKHKQCALIAVDEIINNIDGFLEARIWALDYWQEVKQEIEKL